MILFSENITNRLQYVCDFIGKEILKKPIIVTRDKAIFIQYDGLKINYSRVSISSEEFYLPPHPILFENDIKQQQIKCRELNGTKIFFQTKSGDFPFDIFAATFFLLSRYEEYLPHEKDEYGRFSHKVSIAHREGFLHLPLVNFWLDDFIHPLP